MIYNTDSVATHKHSVATEGEPRARFLLNKGESGDAIFHKKSINIMLGSIGFPTPNKFPCELRSHDS